MKMAVVPDIQSVKHCAFIKSLSIYLVSTDNVFLCFYHEAANNSGGKFLL